MARQNAVERCLNCGNALKPEQTNLLRTDMGGHIHLCSRCISVVVLR